jgi:hypothetical protein
MKTLALFGGFILGLLQAIGAQWGNWGVLRREQGIGFTLWLIFVGAPLTVVRFIGIMALTAALFISAMMYGLFSAHRFLLPRSR